MLVRAPVPAEDRGAFEVELVQPAPMHMAPEPVKD
jgi:hypothetical protein